MVRVFFAGWGLSACISISTSFLGTIYVARIMLDTDGLPMISFSSLDRGNLISDAAEMGVYQLSYGEVLWTDEAFKLDLLRVLIKVDVDLVLVV